MPILETKNRAILDEKNISKLVSAVDVTDDCEVRQKFWIAAYTRPRSEKKASLELGKLGIATYVPIQKQLRTWSDRKKMVEFPVIPMILFANIVEDDIQIIRDHSLIIRVLSQPGQKDPARIPNNQIESLKYMLGQTKIPVTYEQSKFRSEDRVCIVSGSLKGLKGQVKAIKDDMTEVWISIDLLGGAIVKIESSHLKPISSLK